MPDIAFIGLGRMGAGMAARLLASGYAVTVYNRTPEKADSLVHAGARVARTPQEACNGAEAIVSMTADDEASRAVWLGASGILTADAAPDAFAVECSTLSHDWVLELSVAASNRGLRYIDAPVTGLPEAAAAGALTLLVGAAAADLEACRPLLEALSQRIIHFGPVGTGTAYKLIVNLLGAVQIASAAESMAIAERAGLDLAVVADAIASGQAASPQVVRNTRRIVEANHDRDVVFTPALRLKDVRYALALARKLGIGSPFGALAGTLFQKLVDLGHEDANESKIIEVSRRIE
ncbi:MAG: NAD(P)-dependent oxidoreductase [Gammaproteobacteria bacterium]